MGMRRHHRACVAGRMVLLWVYWEQATGPGVGLGLAWSRIAAGTTFIALTFALSHQS